MLWYNLKMHFGCGNANEYHYQMRIQTKGLALITRCFILVINSVLIRIWMSFSYSFQMITLWLENLWYTAACAGLHTPAQWHGVISASAYHWLMYNCVVLCGTVSTVNYLQWWNLTQRWSKLIADKLKLLINCWAAEKSCRRPFILL